MSKRGFKKEDLLDPVTFILAACIAIYAALVWLIGITNTQAIILILSISIIIYAFFMTWAYLGLKQELNEFKVKIGELDDRNNGIITLLPFLSKFVLHCGEFSSQIDDTRDNLGVTENNLCNKILDVCKNGSDIRSEDIQKNIHQIFLNSKEAGKSADNFYIEAEKLCADIAKYTETWAVLEKRKRGE
jgi:hypothetical protein